jgi:membrane-associated protein
MTSRTIIKGSDTENNLHRFRGDFHVIYNRLKSEDLPRGLERLVVNQLLKEHPYVLPFVIDIRLSLPYTTAVFGQVCANPAEELDFTQEHETQPMADLLINFIDIFLHLDRYLADILQYFGVWTYVLMFFIIFCETGLVVTPILPGDSLLFGLGAFAANPYLKGPLEVEWLFITLSVAAIAGDTVNYTAGHYIGPKIFQKEDGRFFKKAYLERTHRFYEKHGGKTIVIARFMPIIRTFAPFVAGIGRMAYTRFISYNVIGGIAWIALFIFGGYYFGNLPMIRNNFTIVIIAIVILSVLPGVIEYLRQRRETT